jgi:hypothetical protein
MTTPTSIDTTNLLTILGFIAAVWALISPTGRLRFQFCMSWADWIIAGGIFLLANYLVFAPVLETLGLYYSLGPWRWGLDSSSTVYLLLLAVVIYLFWRSVSPKLARGRIGVFRELLENLLLTKRYDELVLLVEQQLTKLIRLSNEQPLLARWVDRLDPPNINMDMAARLRGERPRAKPAWRQRWSAVLQGLKTRSLKREKVSAQAREILLNLVTSPELTIHLAVAHPHFCAKLLEADEAVHSDYIERYVDALLDAPGSRLYVELKNNQYLKVGSRLDLPENNRLLRFFFADAAIADKNGLDRAIGEAVCRRLDEDSKLVEKLNGPLGSYYEVGKFRCPINSGITLFEIMVHEGIHQGLQGHMWLHYFGHFTDKILKQMSVPPVEPEHQEWPTPFHYLLYRLVSVATEWVEQCARIDDSEIPVETRISDGFDPHFISKEATKALGSMLADIIPSEKLSTSFKVYILEVAIRRYINLKEKLNLNDVASLFKTAVIRGENFSTKLSYMAALQDVFGRIDHRMRHSAKEFEEELAASLADAQEGICSSSRNLSGHS